MSEPLIGWDVARIAEEQARFLLDESDFKGTADEAMQAAWSNQDLFDRQWDDLLDSLTEWMANRTQWHAEADSMGWMNRSGYKDFEAKDGQALLQAVLPRTSEFKLKGETEDDGELVLRVWHHDSPMDPDTITITEET
jgi:hypothetical protein